MLTSALLATGGTPGNYERQLKTENVVNDELPNLIHRQWWRERG